MKNNNKIKTLLIIFVFCISLITFLQLDNKNLFVKASGVTIASNTVNNAYNNGNAYNNNGYWYGQAFVASQTARLTTISGYFDMLSGTSATGSLSCSIWNCSSGYGTNAQPTSLLAISNYYFNVATLTSTPTMINFTFTNTATVLYSGTNYVLEFYVLGDYTKGTNGLEVATNNGQTNNYGGNYVFTYGTGTIYTGIQDIWFNVQGDTTLTLPTATPSQPSGTVGVNFMVNNSISYNSFGNITWCVLANGLNTTNKIIGNNGGGTFYFNDGTTILLNSVLDNGYYFNNYTILNNDGSLVYPINQYALTLESPKGIYNITLYISKNSNTVNIQFIDVSHGSIYFQNYINSVPSGVKYGAGIYNVTLGTVLYISTISDNGYNTDYFIEFANNLTSIVQGSYLTFIATTNTTITPHYTISNVNGVNNPNGIFTFLSGLTWQNIAVLIIYVVICGLCTYLFAFTGLIAGLDIATVICFLTGLLGSLMYPVLGLIIVVNIALIIFGSGLLNRRKNGNDA
jgi:hypothetical protein